MSGRIILVTGGNGFLGQHVIKHLQLYGEGITEIRVLDIIPFVQKMDYTATKPVTSLVGNILDAEYLNKSLQDIFAVFHLASMIDVSLFPDDKNMYEVNVKGTEQIIKACKTNNVQYLIYCGSLGSFYGYGEVRDGNETTVTVPSQCAHGRYGETKRHALKKVLQENGSKLKNGNTFFTLGILPPGMYGELDPTHKIRRSRFVRNGVYNRIMGAMEAKIQFAYIGNVAYMFIKAYKAVIANPDVAGQYYFAVDDSPAQSHIEYRRPYVCKDMKTSSWYLPHQVMLFILKFVSFILFFIRLFKNTNFPLSPDIILFVNTTFYVSYDKARTMLGYQPLYDFKTSVRNTVDSIKKHS